MMSHLWRRRLLTGICWVIIGEFFFFAPFKFYPGGMFGYPAYPEWLFGYPAYPVKFVAWGWPDWFSFVVGALEILVAVLLLFPRRRFIGAALLTFIMTGAITTHIIHKDALADSISAPVHLVLAGIVALAYWPTDWRQPLLRRAC